MTTVAADRDQYRRNPVGRRQATRGGRARRASTRHRRRRASTAGTRTRPRAGVMRNSSQTSAAADSAAPMSIAMLAADQLRGRLWPVGADDRRRPASTRGGDACSDLHPLAGPAARYDDRRERVDDERDDEQRETGGHERASVRALCASPNWSAMSGAIEFPVGSRMFGLMIERGRHDQRDGDRLAERPSETEHRAADDAAASERQDDGPDHPPAGAAERERALLLDRRAPARTPHG